MESLSGKFGLNIRVNAQERFLSKPKGVSDPEQKRKIIGNELCTVRRRSGKTHRRGFLRKWIFYTDIIESERKQRKPSSLYHNVRLPRHAIRTSIEPLIRSSKTKCAPLEQRFFIRQIQSYGANHSWPGLLEFVCLEKWQKKNLKSSANVILREEIAKRPWDVWLKRHEKRTKTRCA